LTPALELAQVVLDVEELLADVAGAEEVLMPAIKWQEIVRLAKSVREGSRVLVTWPDAQTGTLRAKGFRNGEEAAFVERLVQDGVNPADVRATPVKPRGA
jgi:hypothetical protein